MSWNHATEHKKACSGFCGHYIKVHSLQHVVDGGFMLIALDWYLNDAGFDSHLETITIVVGWWDENNCTSNRERSKVIIASILFSLFCLFAVEVSLFNFDTLLCKT